MDDDRSGADEQAPSGALDRVLGRVLPGIGGMATVARLSALSGSDFTSVMLEIVRQRAARETPASVLRRYEQDRFVRPGTVSWRALRRAEDVLLDCLPSDVEVNLAPLVPLGTYSALGNLSQHRVVTAVRACEVAADPTNGLALEAAVRRRRAPAATVRLAGVQRVVRAQRFHAAGAFPHFSLFGLVTAGRDQSGGGREARGREKQGGERFERAAVAEHLRFAADVLRTAGASRVEGALTPLSAAGERIAAAAASELDGAPVTLTEDRDRQAGRGGGRREGVGAERGGGASRARGRGKQSAGAGKAERVLPGPVLQGERVCRRADGGDRRRRIHRLEHATRGERQGTPADQRHGHRPAGGLPRAGVTATRPCRA